MLAYFIKVAYLLMSAITNIFYGLCNFKKCNKVSQIYSACNLKNAQDKNIFKSIIPVHIFKVI